MKTNEINKDFWKVNGLWFYYSIAKLFDTLVNDIICDLVFYTYCLKLLLLYAIHFDNVRWSLHDFHLIFLFCNIDFLMLSEIWGWSVAGFRMDRGVLSEPARPFHGQSMAGLLMYKYARTIQVSDDKVKMASTARTNKLVMNYSIIYYRS